MPWPSLQSTWKPPAEFQSIIDQAQASISPHRMYFAHRPGIQPKHFRCVTEVRRALESVSPLPFVARHGRLRSPAQQSKNSNFCGGADVDLAVCDDGRNEFYGGAIGERVSPVRGLVRVIEFGGHIRRIVGV